MPKKNLKPLTKAHVTAAIAKMDANHKMRLAHFSRLAVAAKRPVHRAAVSRAQERAQRNYERSRAAMQHRMKTLG